ncbi:sigma-54 interaction domain-containing protein [Adhaeretor mobilis]|uniref:Transcriptional regulatory protein ZraR n=1 Tax=Adhaeretor mobilis TaxID=1930276 RepID=A0A517MT68_9BACT|nr:sigma-54 dependent transcriptional regulator [Adhaeretor mobilis]QDS98074.1 Transcriptional regulatory protein ZraR [Adhaeretor mobilis]
MNLQTQSPKAPQSTHCILGSSTETKQLRADITRAAPFDSNVLITGPSGSGKELVARAVHSQSARAAEPFVPVDCASLVGELMASQLFGHVEGAFTGATFTALGCFRAANKGTLFLDEIGELELSLQARLLRTLQERIVSPVGSHEGVPVDVRIVAATNRDLAQEVAAGRFREDLYYRLNVVSIVTSPLHERRDDIPEISQCFLELLAQQGMPRCVISPGALEALQEFSWPGNVRQLKNVLEQAVIASDTELLTRSNLQCLLTQADCTEIPQHECGRVSSSMVADSASDTSETGWTTLAQLERDHLLSTLEHTYYNQSAAARLLGISRQSLIRLIKKFELTIPDLPGKLPRAK